VGNAGFNAGSDRLELADRFVDEFGANLLGGTAK
jgi:hypothetical protein